MKLVSFVFLSLALALSLLSTLRQCRPLKFSRKKELVLLLLLLLQQRILNIFQIPQTSQ